MVRKLTNQQQSDRQQKGTEFDRSGQRKQHVGQPERGRVGLACPDWGYADPEGEASVKYVAVDCAHRGPAHAVNAELVARDGNFDLLAGEAGRREGSADRRDNLRSQKLDVDRLREVKDDDAGGRRETMAGPGL